MNAKCIFWPLLVFSSFIAVAQQSLNLDLSNTTIATNRSRQISGGKIITRQGVTYTGVSVQKVYPDGLVVSYSQNDGGLGIAKIKFADLPDTLQRQFGYNSTNAAAFELLQRRAETQRQVKWAAEEAAARAKQNEEEIAEAEKKASRLGTGFFITDDGYLLTCYHVVAEASSIMVGTKQGLFTARLVQEDPEKDVAVLKVAGDFSSLPLTTHTNVQLGESVFTIGFPNPDMQGLQPKLTRGEISGLAGVQDDPDEYQISVPVQPGNSGGALVDERGNVVGIVAARLSDQAALQASGMIAQNVNYAIKSSCAKSLLVSVPGGPLKLKREHLSQNRKFEDVVRDAEEAIALILIQ